MARRLFTEPARSLRRLLVSDIAPDYSHERMYDYTHPNLASKRIAEREAQRSEVAALQCIFQARV